MKDCINLRIGLNEFKRNKHWQKFIYTNENIGSVEIVCPDNVVSSK